MQTSIDPDLVAACGPTPSWVCETAFDMTGGSRFLAALVDDVVAIVVITTVAWILTVIARRWLGRLIARVITPDRSIAGKGLKEIEKRAPKIVPDALGKAVPDVTDPRREARLRSISAVVGSTASMIIWVIAVITCLGRLGIDLAPLIAGAGIAGIALGFGAQSLVKDCIAGLFMLLEDQYGIGDVVDLDEATGTVEKISLRTTVLRGADGTVWHVPNGVVQRVGNRSQLWSVAIVDVTVAYDNDLSTTRGVIADCVDDVCHGDTWRDSVIEEPKLLGVESLSADGVTIRVTVKTKPGVQWALQRTLREALKRALDDAGIEVPLPRNAMWVRPTDGEPFDDAP